MLSALFRARRLLPASQPKTALVGFAIGFLGCCQAGLAQAQSDAWPTPAKSNNCIDTLASESATIKRVSDGDTVVLNDDRRVRLIGINTPELNAQSQILRKIAVTARERLVELLPVNEPVTLFKGTDSHDQHGRVLAHVIRTSDNLAVVEHLLEAGLGAQSAVAPNTLCVGNFYAFESSASKNNIGVWRHIDQWQRTASELTTKTRGFKMISGTVTNVHHRKKHSELMLDEKLSLRVRKSLAADLPLDGLLGKKIEIRGWLSNYKNQPRMRLHHPANLRLINSR